MGSVGMGKKNRCALVSAAWGCQCERKAGHRGMCNNGGDGFYGSTPDIVDEMMQQHTDKSFADAEREIREQLERVRKMAPAGTRVKFMVNGSLLNIELVCSGADELVNYYCDLKPGHKGRCYCNNQSVHFNPTSI